MSREEIEELIGQALTCSSPEELHAWLQKNLHRLDDSFLEGYQEFIQGIREQGNTDWADRLSVLGSMIAQLLMTVISLL